MSFRYQNGMLVGAFALWSIAVATGTAMMWNYANKAGNEGKASLRWPNESQIPRSRNHPTLVMFAHPRCPCTRASIGELAVLMARCHGKVDAQVLFFKPTGSSENWARTDQWRSAQAIPDVLVRCDDGGTEARRFHVETSGHVLLYSMDDSLLFSGGVTSSRGHAGDNVGRDAITALLNGQLSKLTKAPVFGCSLLDPKSPCLTETMTCSLQRHK